MSDQKPPLNDDSDLSTVESFLKRDPMPFVQMPPDLKERMTHHFASPEALAMVALHKVRYAKEQATPPSLEKLLRAQKALEGDKAMQEAVPDLTGRIEEMVTHARQAVIKGDEFEPTQSAPAALSTEERHAFNVVTDNAMNALLGNSPAFSSKARLAIREVMAVSNGATVRSETNVESRHNANVVEDLVINAKLQQSFPALSAIVSKLDEAKGAEQPAPKTPSVSTPKP